MFKKHTLLILIVILTMLIGDSTQVFAQNFVPNPPYLVSPGNGTLVTSNTFQLCASASDNSTSQMHFEVFQGPVEVFQSAWQAGNFVCANVSFPNGTYTWFARAINNVGLSNTSPGWTFTVQVTNTYVVPAVSALTSDSGGIGGPRFGPPISNQVPQNAQQRGVPGGIDLIVYCYAVGENNAGNMDQTALGWFCSGAQFWVVNWGQACVDVYGYNYIAQNDTQTRDGWRCVPKQTSVVPTKPTYNTGSSLCASVPSRLQTGDFAVVSDFDVTPLHIYSQPDTNSIIVIDVPIKQTVAVIYGTLCIDGNDWVEVAFGNHFGWAIEVGPRNLYNLIPTGMPLPGPGGSGQGIYDPSAKNALGMPLLRNKDGDLIYPVAYGLGGVPSNGSYIHVPSVYKSLLLRTTPVADKRRKNVIGTMNPNDYYWVTQIGQGWIQVQTTLAVGWVSAQYIELTTR